MIMETGLYFWLGLRVWRLSFEPVGFGHGSGMRTDRSARRGLAIAVGIAAIFDLTGAITYRVMHPILPDPPPRKTDPFQSAMATILSAHRDAVTHARDKSGVTLAE